MSSVGRASEPRLQPVKEIGQYRQDDAGLVQQTSRSRNIARPPRRAGLRRHRASGRTAHPVCRSRSADLSAFDCSRTDRPVSVRSCRRRGRQAGQRRPQRFLDLRGERDLLMIEQRADPFRGPTALGRIVNSRQRLERQRAIGAKLVMRAVHRQHGRTRRIALVEDVDLGVRRSGGTASP